MIIAESQKLSLDQEAEKMAMVCGEEKGKRLKNMLGSLLKRARESDRNNKEISIYFCPAGKDAGSYDQSFLLSCLLFIFIRQRSLKLKLVPSTQSSPKVKKPDVLLKCRRPNNEQFRISKRFHEYAAKVMKQTVSQSGEYGLHFETISIECAGDNIQGQVDLLRRRGHAFEFIYNFFDGLKELIGDRRMFLLKNSLSLSCRKEKLEHIPNVDTYLYGEEAWTKRIIKLQEDIFITGLTIKTRTGSHVEDFKPEQKQPEEMEVTAERDKKKMGFFSGFSGNQCQYISRLALQFATVTLAPLEKLISRLPNLSHLRIIKAFDQVNLQSADSLLVALTHHNPLIQLCWLSNIKVDGVNLQVFQGLYDQCPYMTDLEIGLPSKYFSGEGNEQVRECATLLKTLHLRKVSLMHNLEMAKLLIAKEYNVNEVIEIIDAVQPFVF